MKKILSLVLFLLVFQSRAIALYSNLAPSFRAYPIGATIEGMLGKDWYLYDDRNPKEFWKFGLLSLKAKGAAHGLVDLTLSTYPISFVKIDLGLGGTYRYYNTSGFDCLQNICQGFLARTGFGFSFLLSFGDQDEFILVPGYKSIAVSHGQTNKRIVDETEYLIASAGGDTLDQSSLFFGKTLRKGNVLGFYLKQSQYRNSQKQNEMQLIVMSWDWKKTAMNFGIGRYASDYHVPGFTLTAEYEWKWGESLALF